MLGDAANKRPKSLELGRTRQNLTEIAPSLVDIAQHRPKSPEVVHTWPKISQVRPTLAEVAEMAEFRSNFGRST